MKSNLNESTKESCHDMFPCRNRTTFSMNRKAFNYSPILSPGTAKVGTLLGCQLQDMTLCLCKSEYIQTDLHQIIS